MNKVGFTPVIVLFIVIGALVLSSGIWYYLNKATIQNPSMAVQQVATSGEGSSKNTTDIQMTTSSPDLMAIVSTQAQGFNISILVNGQDIGLKGNSGGGARLFNSENSYYKPISSPEVLKQNGILHEGENTISIFYQKIDPQNSDTLHIDLQMQGYPAPLFSLDVNRKTSGTVTSTIDVEATPPADFTPVNLVE